MPDSDFSLMLNSEQVKEHTGTGTFLSSKFQELSSIDLTITQRISFLLYNFSIFPWDAQSAVPVMIWTVIRSKSLDCTFRF
jgi:hypothetical protein